jgi:bacteriorhodopsin
MEVLSRGRWTSYLTVIGLSIALILQFVVASRNDGKDADGNTRQFESIGVIVCYIALMHYVLILMLPHYDTMLIRYSDWLLTLPLLLYKILLIRKVDIDQNIGIIIGLGVLLMIMLYTGWRAERLKLGKPSWWVSILIGCLSLFLIYILVFGSLESPKVDALQFITTFFFLMWILYGVVALNRENMSTIHGHICYDVLDFCTKGVFGILVAFLITFYPAPPSCK